MSVFGIVSNELQHDSDELTILNALWKAKQFGHFLFHFIRCEASVNVNTIYETCDVAYAGY
ncbi:MAG: hypothetical protein ABSG07_03890 [Terriglobales bacterium]